MTIANDSFLGWARFALAREFVTREQTPHVYQATLVERCGGALRWGVGSALDHLLREIRNPIVVVAIAAIAAVAVTIAFYPAVIFNAVVTVIPIVARLEPWMAQMALYILTQTTLLGITLRAYGRFQNNDLKELWKADEIRPLFIGAKKRI